MARRCRNPAAAVLAQAIRGQCPPSANGHGEGGGGAGQPCPCGVPQGPSTAIGGGGLPLAPLLGFAGDRPGHELKPFNRLPKLKTQSIHQPCRGGIWEALLTTAAGLTIAIPVVAVLNWLEGRVEQFIHGLADLTTRVFTTDLSQGSTQG